MRRRGPQGLHLVFKDGADLLLIHAGEPFDKLADRKHRGPDSHIALGVAPAYPQIPRHR